MMRQGRCRLDTGENLFSERAVLQWHRLPREVGAVTVPGGVPEPCGCGTEDVVSGHSGDGLAVGPGDLSDLLEP